MEEMDLGPRGVLGPSVCQPRDKASNDATVIPATVARRQQEIMSSRMCLSQYFHVQQSHVALRDDVCKIQQQTLPEKRYSRYLSLGGQKDGGIWRVKAFES